MNKHVIVLLVSFLFLAKIGSSQSQVRQPAGGGSPGDKFPVKDELTTEQRASIANRLKENEARLLIERKLNPLRTTVTAFAWPLKQAVGFNDRGFYNIGNYVDENLSSGATLEYNCGGRTYDGHMGTDIGLWPWGWQKMSRSSIEIIAAAAGTIIGKDDGNPDQSCSFCSGCYWNAVYIMHADGSVAWYGHMKTNSLTAKTVGQTVAQGEYLGLVGSSGYSTGPHLHLEVYKSSTYTLANLVDPWFGGCNNMNPNPGWWASQQPYRVSTLNKVMTHGTDPVISGWCPTDEIPNEKINFWDGQRVYVATYYRDQLVGDLTTHTIYRPDNSVWQTWTSNSPNTYSNSYWYWWWTLPAGAMPGNWRYEAQYNSTKNTTWFTVNSGTLNICPNSMNPVFSNLTGTTYQWQVNTGSGFVNISDNSSYGGTASNQLQLKNLPSSFYGYQYRCRIDGGGTYSHTITLKFVSYWNGFKNSNWEDPGNWSCGNMPDANTDVVIQNDATNFPEVNSLTSCRTATVNTGATLTVKPGFKLTVTH